ncbi:MAG TPA: phosphatase PAP2 family protein [Thermoanaerobaculia bacterium]
MPRIPIALTLSLAISCATAHRYGRLAVADVQAVATAPLHASAKQWTRAGVAAGAVAATTLLDHRVRDAVARNHSHALDDFTRVVEPLGGGRSTDVMLAFALYGVIRDDQRAKLTAFDSFMSSVIASQAITPIFKRIANRTRPNGGTLSFPSNHATEAFALATSVSENYPAARFVAYGLAGAVGFARIYHNAHWISDVAGGAVIGSAVARKVARTNRIEWNVVPSRRGAAITISTRASALFRAPSAGSTRPSGSAAAP